ncbi:MAG: PGF-pre-PGF domain-containing protein [Nanoarchaeota archaeon]|nr:PGF-pre-PGF domain-containing protein [Nanoarchaeota archaeon]
MRLNSKFTLYGIFVLIAILAMYFVLAASWNLAPSTTSAGSTIRMIAFNVSNNSHANGTNVSNFTSVLVNITGTAYLGVKNVTNVTISNGTPGFTFFNSTFTTAPVNITVGVNISTSGSGNNWTVNFTLNSSAKYNLTVGANVTVIGNRSWDGGLTGLIFSALPYNSSLTTVNVETTAPVATATCSPKEVFMGDPFPCSCSGTDSGAADSGVATTSGSSNAPDGTSIPQTIGVFTYTCTVTDNAGNSGSNTATYVVLSSGGGSATPSPPKNSHSWSRMTPGVVSIMKDFNPEIGVKEIQITVNNEAQNVQITVTKYDGKPAEVSVSKTGKVYQYLQIDAQNLGNNLEKATVQFRVEKSWVSSNGLNKDQVSVYKLNGRWDKLETTYESEDATHYYYNVELDSFSYFAISEGDTSVPAASESSGTTTEESGSLIWLWILLAVALVVVIWVMARKKR